jgi:hypothetical protein
MPQILSRAATIGAADVVDAGGGEDVLEVMWSILACAQAFFTSLRAWQVQKNSSIILNACCIDDWG